MQNVLQKSGNAHGIIGSNYVKIASKEKILLTFSRSFYRIWFWSPHPSDREYQ